MTHLKLHTFQREPQDVHQGFVIRCLVYSSPHVEDSSRGGSIRPLQVSVELITTTTHNLLPLS